MAPRRDGPRLSRACSRTAGRGIITILIIGQSAGVSRRFGGSMATRGDAMPETLTPTRSLPLTDLSEDERMFRQQVRDFAESEVRPLVGKMEKEAHIPRELIDKCFDLGIMGIEIPESAGGAGATFFMSVLVVEELARVDASLAVLVGVPKTPVDKAPLRGGAAG